MKAARRAAAYCRERGVIVEIIGVLDRATEETRQTFEPFVDTLLAVDYGDLGETRNYAVGFSAARFVCFCDADDLFGETWVYDAYCAATLEPHAVYHPQLTVFFGDVEKPFLREHVSSSDARFDFDGLTQFNAWSALCFADRRLLLQTPYVARGRGCGYEDWQFNLDTLAAGVPHVAVANTVQWVRVKVSNSLCRQLADANTVVGPTAYYEGPRGRNALVRRPPDYDRRWFRQEMEAAAAIEPQCWVSEDAFFETTREARAADAIWAGVRGHRDGVVIVAPSLATGGVANVVRNVVRFYREGGWPVTVLLTDGDVIDIEGARVIQLFNRWTKMRIDEQAYALQTVCVQLRPRCIHAINSPLAVACLKVNPEAMRRTAKFYAWTFGAQLVAGRRMSWAFWDLQAAWRYVDAIITDSHYWADQLQELYGYPELHVVRNPAPGDNTRLGLPYADGQRLEVLWAGRLDAEKGVDFLIEVAKRLDPDDVRITVAGTGTLESEVRSCPALNYVGGFQRFAELPPAHIFLMTSPAEGAANVLLEAQQAGLMPVVPAVGGLPEICYGGLVLPRTVDAFVEELTNLRYGDPDFVVNNQERGQRIVGEQHRWEDFVADLGRAVLSVSAASRQTSY